MLIYASVSEMHDTFTASEPAENTVTLNVNRLEKVLLEGGGKDFPNLVIPEEQ